MKKLMILMHIILTIITWTSWAWLSWEIIAVLSLMHIVLLETCDGCFLSHAQFHDKESNNTAFYEWWLGKLGIKKYNRKILKLFMRYYVPLILVLLGIIVQEIFNLRVII